MPKYNLSKLILTALLIGLWCFFVTAFYRTLVVMLLFALWNNTLQELVPAPAKAYCKKAGWAILIVSLFWSMPRYRVNTSDRVRLVYLDREGNPELPPIGQYLCNVIFPEAEIMNVGISTLSFTSPFLSQLGIGKSLVQEVKQAKASGEIDHFLTPYSDRPDFPLSGAVQQCFNTELGADTRAVYITNPTNMDKDKPYPLVVFCHGYLGNWLLYQGIWSQLHQPIVLSIGTRDLNGIFTTEDVAEIFSFYLPALERMGYSIDRNQLHLIGLSNGGSAITAAMNSRYAKSFKSLTTVSANLGHLRRVSCRVNLIGGGRDKSSNRLPKQYRKLKRMGVDAHLCYYEDEGHFVLVNRKNDILDFYQQTLSTAP